MATVFIVICGEYSDTHVREVFFDEEKANKYAELHDGFVMKKETHDEKFQTDLERLEEYYMLTLTYTFIEGTKEEFLDLEIKKQNSIAHQMPEDMYYEMDDVKEFWLHIKLSEEIDVENEEVKHKYHKVVTDIFAQIRSLIETEGWSEEMVEEWLNNKKVSR